MQLHILIDIIIYVLYQMLQLPSNFQLYILTEQLYMFCFRHYYKY